MYDENDYFYCQAMIGNKTVDCLLKKETIKKGKCEITLLNPERSFYISLSNIESMFCLYNGYQAMYDINSNLITIIDEKYPGKRKEFYITTIGSINTTIPKSFMLDKKEDQILEDQTLSENPTQELLKNVSSN